MSASLLDGLVAFWDFAEGGGAVAHDRASFPIDATISSPSTGWIDSPFGFALNTNGGTVAAITDAGVLTADTFLSNGVSMAAWVYPTTTSPGAGGQIISIGGYIILDYRGNVVSCEVDGSGTDIFGSTTLALNTWTFVAFTCDESGNITFYNNAVQDGAGTQTLTSTVSGRATAIGEHPSSSGFEFPGRIALPRIWNKKLSGPEVAQQYIADQFSRPRFDVKALLPSRAGQFVSRFPAQPFVSPPPATSAMRGTASPIGTRVGSRQLHRG